MNNNDESVGVDLNNIHTDSSDVEYSCDEDANVDVKQSSNGEDDSNNDNDEESVGIELSNSQAVVGDHMVNINPITPDEIHAMEFGTVSEAYEFYYRYEKCKGFSIKKSNVRQRGPEGSEIVVMRQFLCNKHGLRDKKHLTRVDRKRDHQSLTGTECAGENVNKAIYSNFTPEQFEEFLWELVNENELEGNPWVSKTYENKSLWATAYLRDKFFGRIRTKSQCEVVNASHLPPKSPHKIKSTHDIPVVVQDDEDTPPTPSQNNKIKKKNSKTSDASSSQPSKQKLELTILPPKYKEKSTSQPSEGVILERVENDNSSSDGLKQRLTTTFPRRTGGFKEEYTSEYVRLMMENREPIVQKNFPQSIYNFEWEFQR
ncbi:unnamed protein product [Vicia faba]|uniref:FAR1 domain-containing protein n=1 Tax=Vicia faba TaxID=3906 RepID=A0AAV1B7S5_VICFA|nr:unnamed protein product [Vicia faba]